MNHPFTQMLAALLLCLATQSTYGQGNTTRANQDLSTWQLVSLTGKGIKFKLPQDWQHDGLDMESVKETFTNQEVDWSTPNRSLQNTDRVRIFVTSYHNGFVSFGHPKSREEMLADKLDRMKTFAQAKAPGSSYSEIQIVNVSGVEGVFRLMNSNSKDRGSRLSLDWTGYRVYQGKAQEIDISIGSGSKGEGLLRGVFSTLELEQDIK